MQRLRAEGFSLKTTLDSGQLFRYWPHEDGYLIGQRKTLFFVRQKGDLLEFEGCDKGYLRVFLGLDDPIEDIMKGLKDHRHVTRAARAHPGIRLIKQDPWECLIGFICSSASNIPKIKRNMEGMANTFGEPLSRRGTQKNSFPDPGEIDDIEKIKAAGTGFRARFIYSANEMIADDRLARLKNISYEDAKAELIKIPGVGSKIADCVLLFSLGFKQPFPVDVWMQRAMNELYPQTKKMSKEEIEEHGRDIFGPNAGYAQQYIYHWRRNLGIQ